MLIVVKEITLLTLSRHDYHTCSLFFTLIVTISSINMNLMVSEISVGNYFVCIDGKWGKDGVLVSIINVYAPCELARKKIF